MADDGSAIDPATFRDRRVADAPRHLTDPEGCVVRSS
jgi:hypothetical protein